MMSITRGYRALSAACLALSLAIDLIAPAAGWCGNPDIAPPPGGNPISLPGPQAPQPGWIGWDTAGDETTSTQLAAATVGTTVFFFRKGDDGKIYMNTAEEDPDLYRPVFLDGWRPVPGGLVTKQAPAAVSDGKKALYLFATDILESRSFMNVFTRATGLWSGWTEIGGTTNVPLAAAVKGSKIYLFAKGGSDGQVYFNVGNGKSRTWHGWTIVPDLVTIRPFSAAVSGSRVYLFAVRNDRSIAMNVLSGTRWKGWQTVPGTTDVAVAALGRSRDVVLFTKDASNGGIYLNRLFTSGQVWSGRVQVPGGITDAALAATEFKGRGGRSRIYLVAKGINDRRVYTNANLGPELPPRPVIPVNPTNPTPPPPPSCKDATFRTYLALSYSPVFALQNFGSSINGRFKSVTNAESALTGNGIFLVKAGHSTTECGDSSAGVFLLPGQSATAQQLFGQEPPLPVSLFGCYFYAGSSEQFYVPSAIAVDVTYNYCQ